MPVPWQRSWALYPLAPGSTAMQLSAPLVDRAVIYLYLNPYSYPGEQFVIETEGNQPGTVYIQSATLNGEPLDRSWISHEEIVAGGTLHYVLGPDPSSWATSP